ncbi:tetratricopeptide repeat protein [Fulvivirgaceae bacterium PWU4]|uniref:histidine kinase n=1 Tax=Chryseosolibacter histidini TaxID=2782349 RepID=A0AAP2GLY4_9BACT|nr:tetratricopeptide repeat protein [Chryseosolibacter histidini]MBT1695242.1 tetratricopeptide repeat protein [Chryseosolibacter histidini]
MLRLFFVLALFYVQALPVFGQANPVDSLSKALEDTRNKRERVDILNELSFRTNNTEPAKSLDYATRAYQEAYEIKYSRGIQAALSLQGYYYYQKGEHTQALEYLRRSSAVTPADYEFQAYNLIITGNVFRATATYDSARQCYQRSISLLNGKNAPRYLAIGYKNLGKLCVLEWKLSEAREALQRALQVYESMNNRYGIADTWFALSDVSKNEAKFAEAREYVNKGCQYATELNNDYLKIYCLSNEADVHYKLGDYTRALKIFFEALELLKARDLPMMEADLYSSVGDAYEALGQNDMALKYFLEALKITERTGMRHETGKLYSNMAWIYKNQMNFRLAHDYIRRSLELRKAIGDAHGISNCYNVLGVIYMQEKKYKESTVALEQALEIRKRIGHREGVSASLFNIAIVYEEQKQYQKALAVQTEALTLDEAIGNKFSLGISYNGMGNLLIKLRNFPAAAQSLKQAGKLALETGSRTLLMNNNFYWSQYFEATKDPARALQYYKKFASLNDSIYNDMSAQKLAELQALYQIEKKDQEIKSLNLQRQRHENEIELQRSQLNQQSIIIISAICGIVTLSLLAIVVYRYNRRLTKAHREITEQKEEIQSQSEELIEANQTIAEINRKLEEKIETRTVELSQAYKELDTFFYRSSHDFRRPLTTFLGLSEVAKITVKDSNALELFDKVKETATNLDKMLVKLQSISDVGSQQLVYKEVMIKEIFDTVCDGFRSELQRKNIRVSSEIRLTDKFISYPAMIRIIIENLVENAIHFSGTDSPFIKLRASQTRDYITIDLQDNGQGIAKEYQDQVFDMYYRANERSKGNGLGLYIVKKAVEKLDGSISLSSIPLIGSTFTIMLPMAYEARKFKV